MHVLEQRFWWLVALVLAGIAALAGTSMVEESQTWDEAIHLSAGYSYWKTGRFRMNPQHPPLGKLLNALPLLALDPVLDLRHESWQTQNEVEIGSRFLYQNRVDADRMLLAGRSITVVLHLLLAAGVAGYARAWFGAPAGLIALLLIALDPNLMAHGRYVTTDTIATLFYFVTSALWIRWLTHQRRRDLWLAGVSLGAALAAKFSCVALAPVLLLLWGLRKVRRERAGTWRSLAAVFLLAGMVVLAAYGVDSAATLPRHAWIAGLQMVLEHNSTGHTSYLLGTISQEGSRWYFPVTFLVKSPLALLLALPLLAVFGRRPRFEVLALLIPPAFFFAISVHSRINLGVRHLLPVYPFLYVLAAAALVSLRIRWRAAAVAALLGLQLFEHARIYPDYLAFFNLAAGGPDAGPRYLLDSNLDWGQDVKKLARHMKTLGTNHVCTIYFGNADWAYYGLAADDLPRTQELARREALDCVVAASVTPLYGLYADSPEDYRWLRERRPDARIGHSIYVYDLRKKK